MFGLVVTIDKPTSEKVVRRRSYLTDIAGNLGGGVSHGWHFQFRHSLRALKGKRRRKADLSGKYPVHFEGIRNPNIGDLPFGNVDQPHWKSSSLFFRTHGEKIFLPREEFFANLALFDLAAFSKLPWRRVVDLSEGTRKSGR